MLTAIFLPSILPTAATAQTGATAEPSLPTERTLIIGTKEAAPFSMKGADGRWQGISIDLFERIAAEQGWRYEYRELPLADLLLGVEQGTLDAVVAALTITPEREAALDFSHPFSSSGLGIAVPRNAKTGLMRIVRSLFSSGFWKVLCALTLILLVAGTLVWLFERHKNPEEFGGGLLRGLGHAFWWSAVTMTTVGYGDKSPRSLGGRIVALVWMFASVIIISGFTAAIASSLTLGSMSAKVSGPEDLRRVRVTTLGGTTSADYLRDEQIRFQTVATVEEAVALLATDATDAVVYDAPILQYLCQTGKRSGLLVLSETFQRQDYGIALPPGSPLREPLNQAILEQLRSPWWQDVLYRYLGE